MPWITNIRRGFDGLEAQLVEGESTTIRRLDDFSKLGFPRRAGTRHRCSAAKISIKFGDLFLTPREDLVGADAPPSEALSSQVFYSLRDPHLGFVIIPAQELIRATFGINRELWSRLFKPIALPTLMELESSASRELIDWVSRFPSARAAWSHVYASALTGKLSFKCPKAYLSIACNLYPKKPFPIVCDARLIQVSPMEEPVTGPRTKDVVRRAEKKYRSRTAHLLRADGSYELSDEEWDIVAKIIQVNKFYEPSLLKARCLIDMILACNAKGLVWAEVNKNRRETDAAYRFQESLKSSGIYRGILDFLKASRGTFEEFDTFVDQMQVKLEGDRRRLV